MSFGSTSGDSAEVELGGSTSGDSAKVRVSELWFIKWSFTNVSLLLDTGIMKMVR